MAGIMRNSFTEGMKADLYAYGFEAYDSLETMHDKIFEVVGSDRAYIESTELVGAGEILEKPENDPIVFENAMEGFTVRGKNRTFAKGIEFSFEAVEDMPKEKIANLVREYAQRWGERANQAKEEFAAQMFNYGGYTAGHDVFNATITGVLDDPQAGLLYDNKPLFNKSDNLRGLFPGDTGAYYNGLALALTADNLETLYLRMTTTNNVDSRGKKIALKPQTLLVPSNLYFTALKILNTSQVLGSANNDINPMQNLVTPMEWQYLTDTGAWYLGIPGKGLKFHNRMPLTFDFYQDGDTKAYKATVMARWGAHAYNWRYWHGSNFSTS